MNSPLHNAGTVLFGPYWQRELARALSVNDRTVRRWAAGDYPVPQGIWDRLRQILREHELKLKAARQAIPKG